MPKFHDTETLYIGIDVGKESHVAAFLSKSLLEKHRRFDACPTKPFTNTIEGFESLMRTISTYTPLGQCVILMEHTGHYHFALQEYLQNHGIPCYEIHVVKRPKGRLKSDKRDAQGLANTLYNQLELGVQPDEPKNRVRESIQRSETATRLHALCHRRGQLQRDIVQRKNKLTAILDQLFPEAKQIIKDPNCTTGLNLRDRFATAQDVANASIADLRACCAGKRPGYKDLARLQELARRSVGTRDPVRIEMLVFQKRQLIQELRMLQEHLEIVEAKIDEVVKDSREGAILMSIPPIGSLAAAAIIAHIGCIAKFESAQKLRGFFGWSPRDEQTGTTLDLSNLSKNGNRYMRTMMYLVAWAAVKSDNEWRDAYQRLVDRLCGMDSTGKPRGKNKAIGRIAGQITALVYALLRKDYELLRDLEPGAEPPPPTLYNPQLHQAHRVRGC